MIVEEMAESWEPEEENDSDLFREIYVETATGYIYEVQMFENFCLARIASPNVYSGIRKFTLVEFAGKFHEFGGDIDDLHDFLRGANPDFIIG